MANQTQRVNKVEEKLWHVDPDLPTGIYQHYKGGLYLVLGIAEHTDEEYDMVVYVGLDVREGPRMRVRPLIRFTEMVTVDEKFVPRFEYRGNYYTTKRKAEEGGESGT